MSSNVIKRRIPSRSRILATILTSVVFLIVPILIIIIDPIHIIVNYKLRLAKGTILYELLQHEILGPRVSIYLFNITNADRFLAGEDYKMKLEQVGPFVYQEYRWQEDLEISEDGMRLEITPKVRADFIPEASIAHPRDINLTLPNLAMLGATAILSNYPSFVRFTYNTMAAQLGSKAIINIDVHNYLWGYNDPLVTICNRLAPGLVYFDRLGILDRIYENDSDYRMVLGATNHDRFSVKSVKKVSHLRMGSNQDDVESVQTFSDTYEGAAFPPMLTPDFPINLYKLGICKTLNLEYIGSKIMDYGGEGFVYTLSNKTFLMQVNPITSRMYPDWIMDVSECYYGFPFVVSKGHFLDADPKILDRIDGLNPDRNAHVNEIIIDRKASVTLDTKMALQLSVVLDDISYNNEARMLSNMIIPFIYAKVEQPKMTDDIMGIFVLVYKTAPKIVMCIAIVMFLIGLAILACAVRLMYLNCVSSSKAMVFESSVDNKVKNAELPLIRQ